MQMLDTLGFQYLVANMGEVLGGKKCILDIGICGQSP